MGGWNFIDDFGYGFGSDPMFNLMSIIFPIFFLIIVSVFIVIIIRGIIQWSKNNASPVLTVPAKIVNMRHETRGGHMHHSGTLNSHASTRYYVTFEVESGDRMELELSGTQFGLLALHDIGRLTFQGTRYKDFRRIA